MINNINKCLYVYFFLLIPIHSTEETYIFPLYEKKQVGYLEIKTKTILTKDKNNNFFNWNIQNLSFAILGFSALGTFGYIAYDKYTKNKIFQTMRKSIKKYLIRCINEESTLITACIEENQILLHQYKKIIQQEKKDHNQNKILLLALTGIISAIAAILVYNYSDSNDYNYNHLNKSKKSSDNIKINSDNVIFDNSKNTFIINNNNYNNNIDIDNNNYYYNGIDNKFINQKFMKIFAQKILLIIAKSNYFKSNYNIFLNYQEYLENDCPYINSQELESFFIEIILEIISEKLLSKK